MSQIKVCSNEYNLIVLGSGAAGFSAADTEGLMALLLEKDKDFGGTTARAGGWIWSLRNLCYCSRPPEIPTFVKGVPYIWMY